MGLINDINEARERCYAHDGIEPYCDEQFDCGFSKLKQTARSGFPSGDHGIRGAKTIASEGADANISLSPMETSKRSYPIAQEEKNLNGMLCCR